MGSGIPQPLCELPGAHCQSTLAAKRLRIPAPPQHLWCCVGRLDWRWATPDKFVQCLDESKWFWTRRGSSGAETCRREVCRKC